MLSYPSRCLLLSLLLLLLSLLPLLSPLLLLLLWPLLRLLLLALIGLQLQRQEICHFQESSKERQTQQGDVSRGERRSGCASACGVSAAGPTTLSLEAIP